VGIEGIKGILMKIAIDIRFLNSNEKAGGYQHIYNLVSHLLSVDPHNRYRFLSAIKGFHGNQDIPDQFIYRFSDRLSNILIDRLSVPIEFIMGKIDIFHGPYFFLPNCLLCKTILTIHDLMVFRHPEFLEPEGVTYYKKRIHSSIKRADAIISVSNFTKNEIVELFDIPENKVRVIYNGISSIFRPIKDRIRIEEVKSKYGIKGQRYLLFVGNIEPKKNIETLIHAHAELCKSSGYKYPLLIVGNKTWYFKNVWEVVQRRHVERNIIFTGVINDEDLPFLYNGAEVFIFPSLFEGFGIPAIEAMACGTPVIASNRTSIPEIVADAALYVDPLNISEMVEAIDKVLSNSQLREQLIQKGLKRSQYFSWEKTARETLSLYREIR
jgi:glycosyltransferase involved in cell wall biosynthesis